MKISVIMPVYNEKIYELDQSISSIQQQTYKNFELIIVDDNPKNNYIKKYLLYKSKYDKRIKLIFHKYNLGTVRSANDAILHSTGAFIARMDADDVAAHSRLENQLYFLIKYKLDMSCCNYISFTNNNANATTSYPNMTQIDQKKIRRTMSYINIAMGPTLFFRKNILNTIGLYRNILCEDYDLVARSLIYRYKVGYLSLPLMYKRSRPNSLSGINSLKEFVIVLTISKYIRDTNFDKVIPISCIYKNVKEINKKDLVKYKKFLSNSLIFKKNKSIKNLIKKYFYAFSSILMFKRSFFSKFSKGLQSFLLR